MQAFLHPDAHQEGGLACTNQKLLEQQRLAILDLVRPPGPPRCLLASGAVALRGTVSHCNTASPALYYAVHVVWSWVAMS